MSDDTTTPGENLPALLPGGLPKGVDRVSDLGTLVTLKEAAPMLGVSVKTARRMITRGDLAGAHQVPMPGGRGTHWVVPYSSIIQHQRERETRPSATPQVDTLTSELIELREKVTRLESDLELSRALAQERAHALEQLHLTVRLALNAAPEPRRHWWQRGKARPAE